MSTALSGLPRPSFAYRTFQPLTIITIYLGEKLIFYTKMGESECWNT